MARLLQYRWQVPIRATKEITVNPSHCFQPRRIGQNRWLHAIVFIVAMLSFGLNSANTLAASVVPMDYRIAAAADKFDDTWQVAVAFKMRPPRRLRANRLELAIGSISTATQNSGFVSIGPVWLLPLNHRTWFVEVGFSPTVIVGPTSFNGRRLGGHFHFTSSLAVGARFG
ncbi:MAG: acyloxyacyl hydrolase, partial [Woeseiaceae bacterium]